MPKAGYFGSLLAQVVEQSRLHLLQYSQRGMEAVDSCLEARPPTQINSLQANLAPSLPGLPH